MMVGCRALYPCRGDDRSSLPVGMSALVMRLASAIEVHGRFFVRVPSLTVCENTDFCPKQGQVGSSGFVNSR